MLASSPAGMPSSARAPSGLTASWMPDCDPSWLISAGDGVQAADAARRTCPAAGAGSGCAAMTSGSSSVTINVSQGDGSPRCEAGATPPAGSPVYQATYGRRAGPGACCVCSRTGGTVAMAITPL